VKVCPACRKALTLDKFHKDKSRKRDGHKTVCKECISIKHYILPSHEEQERIVRHSILKEKGEPENK